MIKAFIWDLDGTLFDTLAANIHAYSKAFQDANLKFDADMYAQIFGLRFNEMLQHLAPGISDEAAEHIKANKSKHYSNSFHLVVPNHGLLALLDNFRDAYKTALVTTAQAKNALGILDHFNVAHSAFDTIITGEQVTHGKPDPECYLKAIEALKVAPEECCVFEDSEIGIQAAKQAGAHVIKVAM